VFRLAFPAGEIRGQIRCAPDFLVGGTIIPIDTTSLLLAGAQMTAVWLIPVVVAAIGIGLVLSRRF